MPDKKTAIILWVIACVITLGVLFFALTPADATRGHNFCEEYPNKPKCQPSVTPSISITPEASASATPTIVDPTVTATPAATATPTPGPTATPTPTVAPTGAVAPAAAPNTGRG